MNNFSLSLLGWQNAIPFIFALNKKNYARNRTKKYNNTLENLHETYLGCKDLIKENLHETYLGCKDLIKETLHETYLGCKDLIKENLHETYLGCKDLIKERGMSVQG